MLTTDQIIELGTINGRPLISLDGASRHYEGVLGWERLAERSRAGLISEVDAALIEHQIRQHQASTALAERNALPPTLSIEERQALRGDEPDAVELLDAERIAASVALAKYRASPEGRSERTLELLEEIRDLLAQGRR